MVDDQGHSVANGSVDNSSSSPPHSKTSPQKSNKMIRDSSSTISTVVVFNKSKKKCSLEKIKLGTNVTKIHKNIKEGI